MSTEPQVKFSNGHFAQSSNVALEFPHINSFGEAIRLLLIRCALPAINDLALLQFSDHVISNVDVPCTARNQWQCNQAFCSSVVLVRWHWAMFHEHVHENVEQP